MYLSNIKIKNFRKFGSPGINLPLQPGLNVLIGENDSGKSCIIDAAKLVLGTQSNDWVRLETEDFFIPTEATHENQRTREFEIICIFRGIDPAKEAKYFTEWLGTEEINGEQTFYLKLTYKATRKTEGGIDRIFATVKAGADEEGVSIESEARYKLRATYLKPLRDAEHELIPRKGSRLSQILSSHEVFQTSPGTDHPLETITKEANTGIKRYFTEDTGRSILENSNKHLDAFSSQTNPLVSSFEVSGNQLRSILEKMELIVTDGSIETLRPLGLGSHNLLFIAAELLLLKNDNYEGLKLALIEELEAHLHPQAQLRLISYLQTELSGKGVQMIITTHSNTVASKVSLNELILCKKSNVFPLSSEFTKLDPNDYIFLEKFLDDTKSNLFFANGVILVEGISENILIPTLAELIGRPLHKYGVSIVNVGSTAFLRYSRIFGRKDGTMIGVPVAIVTDRDIPPQIAKDAELVKRKTKEELLATGGLEKKANGKIKKYEDGDVKVFQSPEWTMEYDIALGNLQDEMREAVLAAEASENDEDSDDVDTVLQPAQSKEQKALEIYLPLHSGKKSKSEAALRLAKLLKDKSSDQAFIGKLRSDEYIKYLINAIEYVTEPLTIEVPTKEVND